MKKIAILVNSMKQGGAEKVVQLICNELSKEFKVHLITLENNNFFQVNNKVIHHCLQVEATNNSIKKSLNLFVNAFKLRKYIKKNDITLVQSHLYRANFTNLIAKVLSKGGYKAQIVNHTLPSRLKNDGISGKLNLLLIKLLYKKTDYSISVSKKMQDELELLVKVSKRKVIHNPFDISLIKSRSCDKVEDFIFEDDKKYLIMVGRINSIKRIDIVIQALNKINDRNIHLIIIGKEENVHIEKLLELSFNPETIHFLEQQENPYNYIKNSDILILSSESESFGNVLIESMICGTAVISSDCGGPREILDPDSDTSQKLRDDIQLAKYGILFPKNNIESLVKAIKILIDNNSFKQQYIYKSRKRAEDFSVEKIITNYKEVLNL